MIADQPVAKVEWVDPATLTANDYNPNRVAPVELKLLKQSMMEDGWTQPLVARADDEIVDGFHRWTLAMKDDDVAALGEGLVPVVRLPASLDEAHARMATIRHNRARGHHAVLKMADIVVDLVNEYGIPPVDLEARLGMDDEEVDRLLDHGVVHRRANPDGFGPAWVPAFADELDDDEADERDFTPEVPE